MSNSNSPSPPVPRRRIVEVADLGLRWPHPLIRKIRKAEAAQKRHAPNAPQAPAADLNPGPPLDACDGSSPTINPSKGNSPPSKGESPQGKGNGKPGCLNGTQPEEQPQTFTKVPRRGHRHRVATAASKPSNATPKGR